MDTTNLPEMLLRAEVAELLRCSPKTVDRLVTQGKLLAVKFGGTVRFRRSCVEQFLTESETSAPIMARSRANRPTA